jgi:hypothetical protein
LLLIAEPVLDCRLLQLGNLILSQCSASLRFDHLDDVPSEFGLHGRCDLPRRRVEGGFLENIDHHTTREPAEIASIRCGGRVG